MRRLFWRIYARLNERWQGRVQYLQSRYGHTEFRSIYGGAFNGQERRREIVTALLTKLRPDAIIETGSFRGDTTAFLSGFGTVHTAESNDRFFGFCQARFLFKRHVHVFRGDSRQVLRKLKPSLSTQRCFIYLDAHWEKDLPFREELAILGDWADPIIMVDDFQVPDDPGYMYDSYEAGTLNLDYLPDLPDFVKYFPRHHQPRRRVRSAVAWSWPEADPPGPPGTWNGRTCGSSQRTEPDERVAAARVDHHADLQPRPPDAAMHRERRGSDVCKRRTRGDRCWVDRRDPRTPREEPSHPVDLGTR